MRRHPMSTDDSHWPYGVRSEQKFVREFKDEFNAMIEADLTAGASRSSQPTGQIDRIMLRRELVALMKKASTGTILQLEYEEIREGDVLVELKFPRPGNLEGWHFRIYTGVPNGKYFNVLVWSGAGRKPESAIDEEWAEIQTKHIEAAYERFKGWLFSQSSLNI